MLCVINPKKILQLLYRYTRRVTKLINQYLDRESRSLELFFIGTSLFYLTYLANQLIHLYPPPPYDIIMRSVCCL